MKKILVVDDEPVFCELVKQCLGSFYSVLSAFDGREGLESATTNAPDLILSDILMPKLDGFSLLQHLKKNPSTADIPVVFLSAVQDSRSIEEATRLGATDYLLKPMHMDQLPELVKRYVY